MQLRGVVSVNCPAHSSAYSLEGQVHTEGDKQLNLDLAQTINIANCILLLLIQKLHLHCSCSFMYFAVVCIEPLSVSWHIGREKTGCRGPSPERWAALFSTERKKQHEKNFEINQLLFNFSLWIMWARGGGGGVKIELPLCKATVKNFILQNLLETVQR